MTFDINQLDQFDGEIGETDAEEALEAYQAALLERFHQSPEGKSLLETQPDQGMGFWAAELMYYGYSYEGVAIPRMTAGDGEMIVANLFPQKISLFSDEHAEETIPELVAFWQFLKREYSLPNADSILKFLDQIEPKFKQMMLDPSNFGMAKSFFMMGQAAGYDMTDQEDTQKFMAAYNAGQLAPGSGGLSLPGQTDSFDFGGERPGSTNRKANQKKKKARKMAKASRKKNRKKQK